VDPDSLPEISSRQPQPVFTSPGNLVVRADVSRFSAQTLQPPVTTDFQSIAMA
jgi:hypothetical protein